MAAALGSPTPAALLDAWGWRPVPLLLSVLIVGWYGLSLRRLPAPRGQGRRWRGTRIASFGLGCAVFLWSTCGFLGIYARALFWVSTTRLLVLLLVVPVLLMAGQPIELSRRRGGALARTAATRPARLIGNPLVTPVLVPLVTAAAVFGPVPGLAAGSTGFDTALEVLPVLIGAVIAWPLVTSTVERSSQAVGLSLTVGLFELLLLNAPGLVLRFSTTPGSFFDHRMLYSWSPHPLHDQRLAGGALWCVAAVLGVPFFVTLFWRWLRADAREAAATDVVLDAERIAHGTDPDTTMPVADPPWWLSNAELRKRYGDDPPGQ